MGFISNVLEDFESFLIMTLGEKKLIEIQKVEEKVLALQTSVEYRKTDLIYLVKEGFDYDKKYKIWHKEVNINYGRYPGRYNINIEIPDNYPKKYPIISFKPLDNQKISQHVQSNGSLCVSNVEHGKPNTYWKSYMNIKGALRLAYHLVTDETHTKKMTSTPNKREIKVTKGTIFEDIGKIMDSRTFVGEFCEPRKIKVDKTWKWEEIAFVIGNTNGKINQNY